MPISVIELREQARLLEVELNTQAALSDSIDTRAGVAIGFAGLLAGLLVQVKHPGVDLHVAVCFALIAAVVALLSAFPRRLRSLDAVVVTDIYERMPEIPATETISRARLVAINRNYTIIDLKRVLLSIAVSTLVLTIILSAIAVL